MGFRMDAVGVVVADLQKSIAFYQRLGCSFEPAGHPGTMTADLLTFWQAARGPQRMITGALAAGCAFGIAGIIR